MIGWATLAALFPWLCLGSLSCRNVPAHFTFIILVHDNTFLSKLGTFVHPSFSYMKVTSTIAEKQPHAMMLSPLNFTVAMVILGRCAVHLKSSALVSPDQTLLAQYFTGVSKCCAANFKQANMLFPHQCSLTW